MMNGEQACSRCGCSTGTGTGYCSNCGLPLEPGHRDCTRCGHIETAAPAPAGKSKIAAGVLALVFGGMGVHNFYLGYTGKGVAQLLISLISLGTLSFISGIWGFIEGIMILCGSIRTDAKGNPLT
jgi:TM2 domain-containing membrane protein YozV